MEKNGQLLILSGPPGAGKDTITNLLISNRDFVRFPTCTTRLLRPGEVNGVHYRFIEKEQFETLRCEGKLLDPVGTHDFYGIPIEELLHGLASGQNLIIHLVERSVKALKEVIPQATAVLLLPPSPEELLNRLSARGMNADETRRRLENGKAGATDDVIFDLVVINHTDRASEAVREILNFLASQKT